jgi:hypothetical protein
MKLHEQRDTLAEAIELAIGCLPNGPTLRAFGIARVDCALVHIDHFSIVHSLKYELAAALAEARGTDAASIVREFGRVERPCTETGKAAREKHIASYTNVKEWVEDPS